MHIFTESYWYIFGKLYGKSYSNIFTQAVPDKTQMSSEYTFLGKHKTWVKAQ